MDNIIMENNQLKQAAATSSATISIANENDDRAAYVAISTKRESVTDIDVSAVSIRHTFAIVQQFMCGQKVKLINDHYIVVSYCFHFRFSVQISSVDDDISKRPRFPGDGAQDSESYFDESSHTPATMSCRPSAQTLKESFLECERQEGKKMRK